MLISKRCSGRVACLLLFSLSLFGCAKKKGTEIEVFPVAGTITLDGKPLAAATVAFYPEGGAAGDFFGSGATTDERGHYELKTLDRTGAAAGAYKVTVSRLLDKNGAPPAAEGEIDVDQLRMAGMLRESLPPRYSDAEKTELHANVEKGKATDYNFDLKAG